MWKLNKQEFSFWVNFFFLLLSKLVDEDLKLESGLEEEEKLLKIKELLKKVDFQLDIQTILEKFFESRNFSYLEEFIFSWGKEGYFGIRNDNYFWIEKGQFVFFLEDLTNQKVKLVQIDYLPIEGKVYFFHPQLENPFLVEEIDRKDFNFHFSEESYFKVATYYLNRVVLELNLFFPSELEGDELVLKMGIPFLESEYQFTNLKVISPFQKVFYFWFDLLALENEFEISEVIIKKEGREIKRFSFPKYQVEKKELTNIDILKLEIEKVLEDFILSPSEEELLKKYKTEYGFSTIDFERLYREVHFKMFLLGMVERFPWSIIKRGDEYFLEGELSKILKIKKELFRYYIYYPYSLELEEEEEVTGKDKEFYSYKVMLEKVKDLAEFLQKLFSHFKLDVEKVLRERFIKLLGNRKKDVKVELGEDEQVYLLWEGKKLFWGYFYESDLILKERLEKLFPSSLDSRENFNDFSNEKVEKDEEKVENESKGLLPEKIYLEKLRTFFEDGVLTEEELEELDKIKEKFSLPQQQIARAFQKVVFPLIQKNIIEKFPGIVSEKKFLSQQRKYLFSCKIMGEHFFVIEYSLSGEVSFLVRFPRKKKLPYQLLKEDEKFSWYRVFLTQIRSMETFFKLFESSYNYSILERIHYLKKRLGEQLTLGEFLKVIKEKLKFELLPQTLNLIKSVLSD